MRTPHFRRHHHPHHQPRTTPATQLILDLKGGRRRRRRQIRTERATPSAERHLAADYNNVQLNANRMQCRGLGLTELREDVEKE